MTDKKLIEKVINHPSFKRNYNILSHIYYKEKNNSVVLVGITNDSSIPQIDNQIIEHINLAYKLSGFNSPTISNIIIEVYNKRGKKLLTSNIVS